MNLEDKFTGFFPEAPENDTVREIGEMISRKLETIRSKLEKSFELLQNHLVVQHRNANDIREHLTEARIVAKHCDECLDRIAVYSAKRINPDDVISGLNGLQETLEPEQDDDTHQILEPLNAASDAMNTLVTSPVESGNDNETLQITGQQDETLEINANVSTEQVSQKPDPNEEMLDKKEEDSIAKLQDLPADLQKIIDFIATSGLSDEKTQNLVLSINRIREAWSIDNNAIEFDKNIFRRRKLLGEGESGRVFSAKMRVSEESSNEKKMVNVAVKEFYGRGSKYPTGEILREVLLQMSLRHDNVVFTYGMCWLYDEQEDQSQGRIVMEKMSHNLEQAISSELITDFSEKERVVRDILEALIYLHQNGIVHRDVKPEHILLNIRDENIAGFAKLSDFGCSRKVAEETVTQMTMMPSVASGAPLYSPPEVIMNPKIRTRKSWDVYSFGIVMCYVFTGGKIPDFEVSEQSARSGALIDNARKWAWKVDDTKYRNIALCCLQKDEKKRSTMEEIKKLMNDDDAELIARNMIVSASRDRTIRRWNGSTAEQIDEPIKGHTSSVYAVGISPSGEMIVSGSKDKTVRRWHAITGEQIGEPLKGHTKPVIAIAISPSGDMIVSGSRDRTIRLWNASTGEPIGEPLKGHTDWVRSVAISASGDMIVSASDDKTIRRWNSSTGQPIGNPLRGHTDFIRAIAISASGYLIVSASDDKTLRRWISSTGEQMGDPLKGHTRWVNGVAISPSGDMIVSASRDRTIQRWNANTGEPIGEPLKGHTRWVNAIAINANGDMIVSASNDGTIRRWDSRTGEPRGAPLRGHTNCVSAVALQCEYFKKDNDLA